MRVFGRLALKHLYGAYITVKCSKTGIREFIRKNYSNVGENFEEVLFFLEEIGVLVSSGNQLLIRQGIPSFENKQQYKDFILQNVVASSRPVFYDFHAYLSKFKHKDGRFVYRPTNAIRVLETAERNLLIELGMINYNSVKDLYYIREEKTDLFAAFRQSSFSVKRLEKKLKDQAEIGLAAEKRVIKYEQDRLKNFPFLIDKIEHTSLKSVDAGYDILSWGLPTDLTRYRPRFIEVKAVNAESLKFYLSRNEKLVAEDFQDSYYIYLLPVKGKSFDISAIQIIANPFKEIFTDSNNWKVEIESFSISKK